MRALRGRAISFALAATALALPAPGVAAVDLSGYYGAVFHEDQPERVPGPDAGDYAGLPITDANRMRGDTWNASLITMPERQCIPHPSPYGIRGIGTLQLAEVRDNATQELVRYETTLGAYTATRKIWMDGRPHPPEWALHTHEGFSTGRWEGDALVVRTTHLKQSYVRRNGLMMSDKATSEERFIRHGDVLHHVMITMDPVYLSEPLVKTTIYRLQARPNVAAWPCRPAVEIPRPKGLVPHNAMGDHEVAVEYAKRHGLPLEGVRGGAHTALPEFAEAIAASAAR